MAGSWLGVTAVLCTCACDGVGNNGGSCREG